MAQAATPPETKNSKTESVNLFTQAFGLETGVLVPEVQIYSSQKILTEILGPLNSLKFHSTQKTPYTLAFEPFPVEVRDSSDRVLFRFFGRPTGQIIYWGESIGNVRVSIPVLADSHQRELLYAKGAFDTALGPGYALSCVEGAEEQIVGKVAFPSDFCTCEAPYKVAPPNLLTNQSTGPLMEAQTTSANGWCCTSDTLLFGCPDPNSNSTTQNGNLSGNSRIVGELKRIPNSVSNNPNGSSEVTFDQNLPIVHKVWILFICYHHHYRNFANTTWSRNGQRGLIMGPFNVLMAVVLGILVVSAIVMGIVFGIPA